MGMLSAMDLAEQFDLRTAVSLHFSTNCYPPIPQMMLDTAMEAIQLVNEGYGINPIALPEGVSFRGSTTATGYDIVDSYRLDAFLEGEEY